MIRVGIVGGGGYTAGELLRLLVFHPEAELTYVHSKSQAGKPLAEVHEDLTSLTDLHFTQELHFDIDALFLCMGHEQSIGFVEDHDIPDEVVLIDLSRDFRLDPAYVYGLPELNRERLAGARRIANPGCFATAIQLALLPLAGQEAIQEEVHIHALTGSTGAGQSPSPTTHFSWRNNNVSIYKAFRHQHLAEINRSLLQLQPQGAPRLNFLPVRGNFSRGIYASAYTATHYAESELIELYRDFYRDAPFVHVQDKNPQLKQVVNTNRAVLHLERHEDKVLIISIIDNLLKGASGQAVENMNLALGLAPDAGLQLKSIAF